MEIKILYHGTDTHFEEFSTDFLATNCSIDQYGSGFYFYDKASKTVLHGALRIKASVTINKSIDYAEIAKTRLSYDDIDSLIIESPDLDDRLTNFGEIELIGFGAVLHQAVKTYLDNDYVDCLNLIGNDFFSSKEVHLLLSKFVELTGIDCITDLTRDIYVILTKGQIEFNSIIHEQDDELDPECQNIYNI